MEFAISTAVFHGKDLRKAFDFVNDLGISLELFPQWDNPDFVNFIERHVQDLRGITYSLHEPMNSCEHTAKRGTKEHARSLEVCRKTFEYAAKVEAKHMVYHHNNCPIPSENARADMIKYSNENLCEMNEIAAEYGIPYLVENAGARSYNNVLLTEDEFIELFNSIDNDCLLDIGHAHCNNWDIKKVVTALGERIVSYHVHDNDGQSDGHLRIGDGTLDVAAFLRLYSEKTPRAQFTFEYAPGMAISAGDLREEINNLILPYFINKKCEK